VLDLVTSFGTMIWSAFEVVASGWDLSLSWILR